MKIKKLKKENNEEVKINASEVYYSRGGGATLEDLLDLIYPIGSVYISSSNVNPASKLGGTWSLIWKQCTDLVGTSTNAFTMNSNGTGAISYVRANNCLRIRFTLTINVPITDTTTDFGTIDLSFFGISSLQYYLRMAAVSDGGNGIAYLQIGTDGLIQSYDFLTRTGTELIATSPPIFEGTFVLPYTAFDDSVCKEWHWKRTS